MNGSSSTSHVLQPDTPPHCRLRSDGVGQAACKPAIRKRQLEPWSTQLLELARHPNVRCDTVQPLAALSVHERDRILGGTTAEADRL